MQITVEIKILSTAQEVALLKDTLKYYIETVNAIVADFVLEDKPLKITSKNVSVNMPSALKAQAIRDAHSAFKKHKKELFKQSKKVITKNSKSSCP